MGIEGIDNLKPSEDVFQQPEWPNVRCMQCGTIYEEIMTKKELAPGITFHSSSAKCAKCPKCGSEEFTTRVTEPEEL